jgi:hypothetical protein
MIEGTPDGNASIQLKKNGTNTGDGIGDPAQFIFNTLDIRDGQLQEQFLEGKSGAEILLYAEDLAAERLNDWDNINDGLETKRADNNSFDTPDTGGNPSFRNTPATPDTAAKPKKSAGKSRRIRFEDGDGGETKEEREDDMKDKK